MEVDLIAAPTQFDVVGSEQPAEPDALDRIVNNLRARTALMAENLPKCECATSTSRRGMHKHVVGCHAAVQQAELDNLVKTVHDLTAPEHSSNGLVRHYDDEKHERDRERKRRRSAA